jgi:hypothetical protein
MGNNPWKENDIVSLEIDTNNNFVHIFVNNILQPISLSNIPFPLKIAVYLTNDFLFLFQALSLYSK